jgi:hypothetical protein
MDIINHRVVDARLLDTVARAALGNATCGVSTGAASRIHLLTTNLPEQQRASDVLNHFGMLKLETSVTSLREGEPDPTVTCRDAQIAADAQLAYLVLRDDEETGSGRLDLTDGAFSFALRKPLPGDYTVLVYRLAGNFASATVQIRVERT